MVSAGYFSPDEKSPEAGFARDMSLHHGQAVEMAMLAYAKGTNDVVRHEGYDIALTQQSQIGTMKSWLDKWHVSRVSDGGPMSWMPGGTKELTPDGRMPGMASDDELTRLNTVTGKDFDILFCQLMIRHHLGGIHMIDAILAESYNTDVVTLAENMKDGQQREVKLFTELLTELGGKPL